MKIVVWRGRSRIAGQGLFTAQDIPQGTRIIAYTGEKIAKDASTKRLARGSASIFTFNTRWDIDGKPLSNKARYTNHSCDPNCTVHLTTRTIWIVAGRDITAGEELTYNDGYELDEEARISVPAGPRNVVDTSLHRSTGGFSGTTRPQHREEMTMRGSICLARYGFILDMACEACGGGDHVG